MFYKNSVVNIDFYLNFLGSLYLEGDQSSYIFTYEGLKNKGIVEAYIFYVLSFKPRISIFYYHGFQAIGI